MYWSRKIALSLSLCGFSMGAFAQFNNDEADKFFEISKNLEIYTNVLKELNTFYVDPINPGKMTKTGLDAMLNELDPYTNFITEAEAEEFEMQFNGKYGGVGTTVKIDSTENIIVEAIRQGSPIDKAGVKPGDIIISIDGNAVKGKKDEEVGLLLKGAPGTKLTMVLQNPVTKKQFTKEVTREEITIPAIPYYGFVDKDKQIGYVLLSQFTPNCGREVRNALDTLKAQANGGLKGIVLDLRGNPGGLVTEAVNICNLFVEKGKMIVSTKAKHQEWSKEYSASNEPWDVSIPLAVLINGNSASASEIVSGALQDLDRAVIIGSKSFGKGLVQVVRPVGYNSRLKVTTAKYYIPSGRCIQALDYTHRNEDGTVAAVPDSLKKAFKTNLGRVVYDGGGIEPDVKIESEYYSILSAQLMKDDYIFNYVTDYYYSHPTIAPAKEYRFSDADYTDFQSWLVKRKFKYETRNEYILSAMKKNAEEEKNFDGIKNEYNTLLAKIEAEKKQDFIKNKSELQELLSSEVVSRYYYQKGQIENQLNNYNAALKKAVELLTTNTAEYKKVLKK
ncbi:S41 family peptidase [Edaphocola aurantiacus]|uniref:S41 family peptidase n=1 Tax=Edaphocola aurantiacus TaxID=2601682 RepID=UPI001C945BC5|nr:S41 family peptidase [Edaphocola aurantiacus]